MIVVDLGCGTVSVDGDLGWIDDYMTCFIFRCSWIKVDMLVLVRLRMISIYSYRVLTVKLDSRHVPASESKNNMISE